MQLLSYTAVLALLTGAITAQRWDISFYSDQACQNMTGASGSTKPVGCSSVGSGGAEAYEFYSGDNTFDALLYPTVHCSGSTAVYAAGGDECNLVGFKIQSYKCWEVDWC